MIGDQLRRKVKTELGKFHIGFRKQSKKCAKLTLFQGLVKDYFLRLFNG
jgi:hypothetical protein